MRATAKIIWARACCLCVLIPSTAAAQTQTTGRIAGAVRDAQDAVIVNANIKIDNYATSERRATVTDRSDDFTLTLLQPNSYELTISALGFAIAHSNNLQVNINQTT